MAAEVGIADYLGKDLSLAFNAMVNNLVTQGIGKATGWQKTPFSWRSVAVSAVAAPLANRVTDFIAQGEGMFDDYSGQWVPTKSDYSRWAGDFGTRLTASLVTGVATQLVRARVYNNGQLDYGQIFADSFSGTIGGSLAEDLARDPMPRTLDQWGTGKSIPPSLAYDELIDSATNGGYDFYPESGDEAHPVRVSDRGYGNRRFLTTPSGAASMYLDRSGVGPSEVLPDNNGDSGLTFQQSMTRRSAADRAHLREDAPWLADWLDQRDRQPVLDRLADIERAVQGSGGVSRAAMYVDLAKDLQQYSNEGQKVVLSAINNYAESLNSNALFASHNSESTTADAAVRYAADLARQSGLPGMGLETGKLPAEWRMGATYGLASMLSGAARRVVPESEGEYITLYRGDASKVDALYSSVARAQGVQASNAIIANAEMRSSVSSLFYEHGLNSGSSPYISFSASRDVAESFARGISGTQPGYVTEVRVPSSFARPNFENPIAREHEYLVPTYVPNRYIVNQTPVKPK